MTNRVGDMADSSAGPEGDSVGSPGSAAKWIAVDLPRIVRLPERLRLLWPVEMRPRPAPDASGRSTHTGPSTGTGPSTEAGPSTGTAPATGTVPASGTAPATGAVPASVCGGRQAAELQSPVNLLSTPPDPQQKRGPDVLTAWLTGFAAEFGRADARLTIVISSGAAVVHLECAVREATALSILVLRGAEFEQMAAFQLLRRLRTDELASTVEDLAGLIEADCVLTLTSVHVGGSAQMEFLLRRGGRWMRSRLHRDSAGIRADGEVEAGDHAVRALLTSVLAGLLLISARAGT